MGGGSYPEINNSQGGNLPEVQELLYHQLVVIFYRATRMIAQIDRESDVNMNEKLRARAPSSHTNGATTIMVWDSRLSDATVMVWIVPPMLSSIDCNNLMQ